MTRKMTSDERILMIEEMIERGEVYHGYRANKYPSTLPETSKSSAKYKPRTAVECSKEKFMSIYCAEKSWDTMAQELGVSRQTCIRLAFKFGIDAGAKERAYKVPDSQIKQALIDLPVKGLTGIARELKMNINSLRYRMKRLEMIW